jgi:lipoprotein-anchoring transpeptidase ErfK/SrfK
VKRLTLSFLIIGSLAAHQAYAQDVSTQPLTRADCDKAQMAWNANANVCSANSEDVSGQPLTRNACDMAGMTWSDKANVCGEKLGGSATQAAPKATNPVASSVLINIDKAKQKMTVSVDGVKRYDWPISTGRPGYATPSGTFTAGSMNKIWYSKQWDNAPMPHAVFFTKEGHAIHGTYEVKRLGKAASHGCVRLSPQNAATLYALVEKNGLENTQVVLAGLTPGGEDKVASPAKTKSRYGQAAKGSVKWSNNSYAESDAQPQRRGGFFRSLFGRP